MPQLDVAGATLHYEVDGDSTAPGLLLLHAGIATLRMWDPLVAALAARHRVIRFDARGFGQTSCDASAFSDRADALAILDHVGFERATIIGASRGGQIAIDITLAAPGRVSGLVTIGSGPSGYPETALTDAEEAAFDAIDAAWDAGDWPLVSRLEARFWAIGAGRDEAALDPVFVATAVGLNEPNITHAGVEHVGTPLSPPAYARVADIAVPALVTVGRHDLSVTRAQQEYLAGTIPDATGATFDAAHLPSVECPAEFLAALLRWLDVHGL